MAEQAAVMKCNKLTECQVQAKEHAQHLKLLEMLHDGKISEEKNHNVKPKGFSNIFYTLSISAFTL
jgi:hypothetical protein